MKMLSAFDGLSGATWTPVRGFGHGRGRTPEQRREELLGTSAKIRIDAMIPDSIDDAIQALRERQAPEHSTVGIVLAALSLRQGRSGGGAGSNLLRGD